MINLNIPSVPELTTDRLLLRRLAPEDQSAVFSLRSDEKNAKYLDRPLAKSMKDVHQFIEMINLGISQNKLFYWAITLRENKDFAGTICLWKISRSEEKAEIGFELLPLFQGRGFAQEAVEKVIQFAFNIIGLQILEAEVAMDNFKSIKILERFNFSLFAADAEKREGNADKTVIYFLRNSQSN